MRPVARAMAALVLGGTVLIGCKRATPSLDPARGMNGETALPPDAASAGSPASASARVTPGMKLAATSMATLVYDGPDLKSTKLGYLRLGAIVERGAAPAGNERCPNGWYAIKPRGFVCVSRGATLDLTDPLLRAAERRPDTTQPLPYPYVFVRAVAPQYLRVPTEDEQYKTEFKLEQHLRYWARHAHEIHRVVPGANDVALDEGARPLDTAGQRPRKRSTEMSVGELLGGESDNDPRPFWLDGGRKIPIVAAFQAAPTKVFSERVRRHTGLAVVGSWVAGPESLGRRFSVTVDLRLIPADKLKPDTGSPFHGVELTNDMPLPIAFVRDGCEPKKMIPCAHLYKLDGDDVHMLDATLPHRAVARLTGKKRELKTTVYLETLDGRWLRARDVGLAEAPQEWPLGARAGKKWIEVSISNETLVLWEGQRPVYATLVSAGQDGLKDPRTTKSTVLGTFRIFNKQITATMDSNERATVASSSGETRNADAAELPAKRERPENSGARSKPRDADEDSDDEKVESPFELRDVPYVQYFESGYALHAAYWHDAFGAARSHGCVNLSPIDARRVFFWTDPPVPEGWHGVTVGVGEGTMVVVHK